MTTASTVSTDLKTLKKVVIVGGGFAGLSVAKNLDQDETLDVTVIDKRDFLLIKQGAVRAAIVGGAWEERTKMPTKNLFKRVKSVRGEVKAIDEANKTITVEHTEGEPTVLAWDYLVLSTGSRSLSPSEPRITASATREQFDNYWRITRKKLMDAKHILVVGSGPLCIELAGELLDGWGAAKMKSGEKKLSMCVGKNDFLARAIPAVPAGASLSIRKMLWKRGARVLKVGEELVSPPLPKATGDQEVPYVDTHGQGVVLSSGIKLPDVDLVMFAFGSVPTTGFVPPAWTDGTTLEIMVDPTLKLKRRDDVFAVGDAAKTGFSKLASAAIQDGVVAAKNIQASARGKPLTHKIHRPGSTRLIVSFGRAHGRTITPYAFWGNALTSRFKSSDLLVQKMYNTFGAGVVPAKD